MTIERPERRARLLAFWGLGFQIFLAVAFALLMSWSGSEAVRGLALLTGIGTIPWLFLVLIFHQKVLVREEAFESEQLRREREAGGAEAIFDVADEQLLLARRRLQWMFRYLLPTMTLLFVALLIISGFFFWNWSLGKPLREPGWSTVENQGLLVWFVGGGAFLSFLFSRYATGMARQPEWRLLHSGAAYLMGVTLAAAALVVALGSLHFFQTPAPERFMAYVLRILLLVLAAETILNLVLDFYRPRGPDEEPRPAFDSRLLGLFTEPGGIARSIAEAINYQFGFEVSSTWFYKLLQRSVVPLIGFAMVTMFLASSLVFVGADEELVIERFGRPLTADAGDGLSQVTAYGPGIHLKWPWPIDCAYKVATKRVHELQIGLESAGGDEAEGREELFLWTTKHAQQPHLNVLAPMPKLAEYYEQGTIQDSAETVTTAPSVSEPAREGEAVPVSQLRVSVVIQYKIRDAYAWLRTYGGEGPEQVLTAIAKQAITRYSSSVEALDLLGGDRTRIEKALSETIQVSAENRQLGIDIVFLGLTGVHPPIETAKEFQAVIGALSKSKASIRNARADSNKRLAEMAGDVQRARLLAQAIAELTAMEDADSVSKADLEKASQRADSLLFGDAERGIRPAGGLAATEIVRAREQRWQWENEAYGKAIKFIEEVVTKNVAPRVYHLWKYMDALAEATQGIRKYVVALPDGQNAVGSYNLNLQDPRTIPFETALQDDEKK